MTTLTRDWENSKLCEPTLDSTVSNFSDGLHRTAMDNGINYPSCIKIPTANSKQGTSTMLSQKLDVKETLSFNNELILLANRTLGEGKWSHTVTSQTIDFVEPFMGKYVCGCATFVRIQLENGIFHEDMGYCHAEGAMKGSSIHCARAGSLADAFKKVLTCFGNQIGDETQKLSKKLSASHVNINQKEDLHYSLSNVPELPEPCAQSTPLISRRTNDQTDKSVNPSRSKCPNVVRDQISVKQTVVRSKSPIAQKGPATSKTLMDLKSNIESNDVSHQKEYDHPKQELELDKGLTELEALRVERKRKQMEKQAEYKRLMKEKEQQKPNDIRKPNSKY